MNKLEELEKQYAKLGEEIEKLKKGKQEKYFVPEKGEKYSALYERGIITYTNDGYIDNEIFKRQIPCRTEEEAEFYDQKRIYETQYRKYLLDHEEEPVNWEDECQAKSYAYYNYYNCYKKEIEIGNDFGCKVQGVIYTTRQESIYEFAKQIGEDNFIKYILIGEYKED